MCSEQMVQSNGVELCVETFGDRVDPAILLIAGAGSCLLSWDEEFCRRLADAGRFVIRYDNRDSGKSTSYEVGRPPYSLSDVVGDAVGLLDGLGLDRTHAVGVSGGGAVAQLLALDHPDRVDTITLASTTPGGPGHEALDLPPMSSALAEAFSGEEPEQDWADRTGVVESLVAFERLFAAQTVEFDATASAEFWGRVFDRTVDIAAQMTNPFLIDAGEPWRARLGDIATPTLVLHGTEDPLFPYEHGLTLAKEIPRASFVAMKQTGHENPPRRVWDVVVPALLEHTSRRSS